MNTLDIIVEKATIADLKTIADFQIKMAWETEQLHLPPNTVKAGVEKMFNSPQQGFYLVARQDNKVIGSLLVQNEWSDWRNGGVWWLHSVYIPPAYRKKGIFRRMFREVEQLAHQNHVAGLRLYVDKTNKAAMNVYKQQGMSGDHYALFEKMLI